MLGMALRQVETLSPVASALERAGAETRGVSHVAVLGGERKADRLSGGGRVLHSSALPSNSDVASSARETQAFLSFAQGTGRFTGCHAFRRIKLIGEKG